MEKAFVKIKKEQYLTKNRISLNGAILCSVKSSVGLSVSA